MANVTTKDLAFQMESVVMATHKLFHKLIVGSTIVRSGKRGIVNYVKMTPEGYRIEARIYDGEELKGWINCMLNEVEEIIPLDMERSDEKQG